MRLGPERSRGCCLDDHTCAQHRLSCRPCLNSTSLGIAPSEVCHPRTSFSGGWSYKWDTYFPSRAVRVCVEDPCNPTEHECLIGDDAIPPVPRLERSDRPLLLLLVSAPFCSFLILLPLSPLSAPFGPFLLLSAPPRVTWPLHTTPKSPLLLVSLLAGCFVLNHTTCKPTD